MGKAARLPLPAVGFSLPDAEKRRYEAIVMLLPLTLAQVYTAATLWCTAAIGVLCSVGLLLEATLGSLVVRAQVLGNAQAAAQLERLVSRVSLEKGVSAVRW